METPACRSVHLIDIENLIGSGEFSSAAAAIALNAYSTRISVGPSDLKIVGVSSGHAVLAVFRSGFAGRIALVKGQDGADRALIEIMSSEQIHERFQRIYCASGDGGFTQVVANLGRLGAQVTVVSTASALSKRLRMAASEVVLVNVWSTDLEAA